MLEYSHMKTTRVIKPEVKVPEHIKVDIALRKDLKESSGESLSDIAASYNLDIDEVKNASYDKLSPIGKALYKKRVEMLESKALALTEVVLEKGLELVKKSDDPKNLSGLAAIGKFADTVYRLENNKPTEITSKLSPEDHAIAFIQMLMADMDLSSAIDAFKVAVLEPIIPEWRKEEIIKKIEKGVLKIPGVDFS